MFVKICKYHFSLFCNACTLTLKIEVPFIEKNGHCNFHPLQSHPVGRIGWEGGSDLKTTYLIRALCNKPELQCSMQILVKLRKSAVEYPN